MPRQGFDRDGSGAASEYARIGEQTKPAVDRTG
jgi:hypothetical protein